MCPDKRKFFQGPPNLLSFEGDIQHMHREAHDLSSSYLHLSGSPDKDTRGNSSCSCCCYIAGISP
jgi:hypothetical protein